MPKAQRLLPPDLLKAMFVYEPKTGNLIWKIPYGKYQPGDIATTAAVRRKNGTSPLLIKFGQRSYAAHNLIWTYVTGKYPTDEVDHENRDPSDNRWRNLREATRSQNQANTRLYRNNKAGIRGVHRTGKSGRWRAMISVDGKNRHLGLFNSSEEASKAWVAAAKEIHGKFAGALP